MAVTLTLGGLNINDGTNYQLLYGARFGEKIKTYDEQRSYTGGLAQTNVTEANYIPMQVPLRIKGSSLANLNANVDAINAKLDLAANDLVFNDGSGSITFHVKASQRVEKPYDKDWFTLLRADVVLNLVRTPT